MSRQDDIEDLLGLPDSRSQAISRLSSPEARAKAAESQRKALRLPDEVEAPSDTENPDDVDSWWPYYDPERDGKHIGKPRKIKSPEEFDRLVDEYFAKCKRLKLRPTMTGALLHLGFVSQSSLTKYSKRYGDLYVKSVSRLRSLIKHSYEQNLVREKGSVQGVVFALKNFSRFEEQGDFVDIQQTELTGKDGRPIEVAQLVATLDGMSEVEKAARLYHMLDQVLRANNVIEGQVEKNDDDETD